MTANGKFYNNRSFVTVYSEDIKGPKFNDQVYSINREETKSKNSFIEK